MLNDQIYRNSKQDLSKKQLGNLLGRKWESMVQNQKI